MQDFKRAMVFVNNVNCGREPHHHLNRLFDLFPVCNALRIFIGVVNVVLPHKLMHACMHAPRTMITARSMITRSMARRMITRR